jgi:dTDP-L-rhamnose 4-epimerase
MRVLVTGGSGYLGSAIVRALVRHGHEPVVFAARRPPACRDARSMRHP